ncbi:MAG: ATP-binding protein [Chlamydiia bacterium]|nr:ATP-binding protein [Chlamydiia bacterium]
MDRAIEKELREWKDKPNRLPLILRGARQVGKSYTVELFGKQYFENCVVVNFELKPDFCRCFEDLEPEKILSKIELLTNQSIHDKKTLLFLDEIQNCPKALIALRYFKEKKPNLHVIAAGSLLEFALIEEDFSFPVGRVEFMYMRPLNFQEYLLNIGQQRLVEVLRQATLKTPPDPLAHDLLIKLLREYMLVGGMPAVVRTFIETKSLLETQRVQSILLESYRNDFGKYASKAQFKYLRKFFEKAPHLVGHPFKYVKVDPEARSRELKVALEQLSWTGLIYQVFHTSANGHPLEADLNEKKFKLLFLDIGLMQNANRIDFSEIQDADFWKLNEGALAEQLVGQELMASLSPYENRKLYYWEKEQGTHEIDYVTQSGTEVVPLEVKAGSQGRVRSLRYFMNLKNCPIGVKISQSPLSYTDGVMNLPLYMVNQLSRLL